MSEVRDPEKKPEHEKKNDRDFISEKIVRPAPSKKQVGTRMATAACAGIIFGVVSAVCFVDPSDHGAVIRRKQADGIGGIYPEG